MKPIAPKITITEETDPVENAKSRERFAKFDRNYAWLEAHAAEVFSHRGKHICIAGQELFVADTVEEALTWAKSVHPEDDGRLIRYIPKTKTARIYAS
ncbi:MAG: hypothetical protein HYX68_25865 [Planctomycetes bacterium]|nr:hypothetical protein [Planctomycetota bacterium]